MLPTHKAILFADDSSSDRYLMIEACKQAGISNRLAVVEDGEQVLNYLEGTGEYADRVLHPLPGLIILDVKMPKVSGLEALQRLRRLKEWATVPVLMLSASDLPLDVANAYRLGADAYLLKPSSLEELVELASAIKGFWLRFNEFPPA